MIDMGISLMVHGIDIVLPPTAMTLPFPHQTAMPLASNTEIPIIVAVPAPTKMKLPYIKRRDFNTMQKHVKPNTIWSSHQVTQLSKP